jgi:two-component system sensor histidine kinase BaeS
VSVALSFGDQGHRIEVTDTGPGIPEKSHARVFERFERLERGGKQRTSGVGLGLALVKMLTTALGGQVELDSEEGRGSTFAVRLPGVARL